MQNEVLALLEAIKSEYANWWGSYGGELSPVQKQMIEEFNAGLRVEEGRKYIKIMKQGSVWGFIQKVDDDKGFRKGDILKPAGYNAPARNKARGNILDGGYKINWTGPLYL